MVLDSRSTIQTPRPANQKQKVLYGILQLQENIFTFFIINELLFNFYNRLVYAPSFHHVNFPDGTLFFY